jgi:hypothetical protein
MAEDGVLQASGAASSPDRRGARRPAGARQAAPTNRRVPADEHLVLRLARRRPPGVRRKPAEQPAVRSGMQDAGRPEAAVRSAGEAWVSSDAAPRSGAATWAARFGRASATSERVQTPRPAARALAHARSLIRAPKMAMALGRQRGQRPPAAAGARRRAQQALAPRLARRQPPLKRRRARRQPARQLLPAA